MSQNERHKSNVNSTTYFHTIVLYLDYDHFQEEKTEYNEEKDMQNT